MPMKNSNDTIGNRSRDLPVCSAVPTRSNSVNARLGSPIDWLNRRTVIEQNNNTHVSRLYELIDDECKWKYRAVMDAISAAYSNTLYHSYLSILFFTTQQPLVGQGLPIIEASQSRS
jgi:hypothetical protein